jgi:peptide/nickel transport system substrate-binding protein
MIGAAAIGGIALASLGGSRPAVAAEPKKGGRARLALSAFNPKSSLDPAVATSDFDLIAGGLLYDNLVRLDTSFAAQPALATEWSADAAGQTWKFKLRSGVAFHDGSPLTAEDVVTTVRRVLDPKTGSSAQSALAQTLGPDGVVAGDAGTVEFKLSAPNAFFPIALGGYNLRITKAGKNPSNSAAVGTGPFVLERFVPGESFAVKRNDAYWRSGQPYLDGLDVVAVAEEAAKLQAVLAGDVDLADSIGVSSARQIEANPDAQLYVLKNAAFNVVAVQSKVAPFDKLAVRQALKHAIDREKLVKVVLQGRGMAGADVPVAADDALFPAGFAGLGHDPDKARSLLKSAGLTQLDVTLFSSDAAAFMAATGVAIQDMVAASGINMKLETIPPSTYWSDIWMKKPAFSSFWLRQHPDTIIGQACESNGTWNEAQFADATFDRLVREARRSPDPVKQKELYAEALPILAQQSGWIVAQWSDRMWPAKSRLKGVRLDFINNADFSEAWIA